MTLISNIKAVWGNASTVFNAIKMDVTNTASHADSKLIDLQVDGVTKFAVRKDGTILGNGGGVNDFDTVSDLQLDTTMTTSNTPVGTIVKAQGFRYSAVASGGDITTAGGAQFGVLPNDDGNMPFEAYGPDADTTDLVTGTDNAALLQSALDTGRKVVIPAPPSGFAYGVSQVKMVRGGGLIGPSGYTLAIRGISTSATITAGALSSELRREFTFSDLYVENNRGGDAVDIDWAPDWTVTRCYFRSVSSTTLGTTAARGFNAKNSERGHFVGQCRFGGNPALRLVKDTNGVRGDDVVASGGSLGLAVDISGCQNVKMPLTIETSLSGVRIGDNTGDNATNGGWCSGIDLRDSYFENVKTPIQAGHGFAVNGLSLDDCWANNGALTFAAGTPLLQIGRVKNLRLNGGRWTGEGTETALKLLATVGASGTAPVGLETSDIDLTVFESTAALLDYSAVSSTADLSTIAATNKVKVDDFGNGFGSAFEWISPTLTANVGYGTMQITKTLGAGGRVTSIELVEGDGGSLSGARLRVGSGVSLTDTLDKTWGAVSPIFEDQGVTSGYVRGGSDMRIRLDAGTGTGTFRIKIKGFIDNG